MKTADDQSIWSLNYIKTHPIKITGIVLHLLFRTLFAVFWLVAGINKVRKDWMSSDIVLNTFQHRLTELPPDSFAVFYLENFAIPLYLPVAWVVTIGELYSAIGLLLGITTRPAAAVAFFILINFSIGGYYDASLIPFYLLTIMFLCYPSGHWLGFDKYLSARYPNLLLFK